MWLESWAGPPHEESHSGLWHYSERPRDLLLGGMTIGWFGHRNEMRKVPLVAV